MSDQIPCSSLLRAILPLPSVQLIGAQKAGTSAIADWLFEGGFRRPQVFNDEPWYYSKEVHFFDFDHRFNRGLEFYAKRFETSDGKMDKPLTMDATPDTLQFAERVHSTYDSAGGNQASQLKIIVILREPVSRELSLYNHLVHDCRHLDASERTAWHDQVLKTDGLIMSFDEFVQQVSIPALRRENGAGRSTRHGLYASHLRKWFELFDREQILVLSYEELQNNPQKLQFRVEIFLGRRIPGKLRRSNSNNHHEKVALPSVPAKAALLDVFAAHNSDLYHLLEENPGTRAEQKPFPKFE